MRACVLVGGGDAPGVNAILRGFVHQAAKSSVEVYGSRYGFEGLIDPGGIVALPLESVRGILPRGGSILGCSTRMSPFFHVTKEFPEPRDMCSAIADRLRALSVDVLVLAGGDGTMLAATRFMQLGIPCVGIPKTIDNDVGGTDQACGFDSAIETATHALDALHSTAESHQRIMIVETMGRYAGWIALRAGIAGGADVVLIPEIPYAVERIAAKVKEREGYGRQFTMIALAEGATAAGTEVAVIEPGHPGRLPRLGGAGNRLATELAALELEHEVRVTVLGHLQRGGSPSAFDRTLGTRLGTHAAMLCSEGRFGRMVSLRSGHITSVPLEDVPGSRNTVDPDGELVAAARAVGIELGG